VKKVQASNEPHAFAIVMTFILSSWFMNTHACVTYIHRTDSRDWTYLSHGTSVLCEETFWAFSNGKMFRNRPT
jgi:hypothetical protein